MITNLYRTSKTFLVIHKLKRVACKPCDEKWIGGLVISHQMRTNNRKNTVPKKGVDSCEQQSARTSFTHVRIVAFENVYSQDTGRMG